MCAIGRALMANPSMVLLDEPSMGLAPQIVEEVFEIVKDLNSRENISFLLAEQNTMVAPEVCRFWLHPRERPGGDGGDAEGLRTNEDVKEFYLGLSSAGRKSLGRKALPPPQALVFVMAVCRSWRRCRRACLQEQTAPAAALP